MEERIYLASLHYIGINHKKLHQIFKNNTLYKSFFDNLSINILKKYNFDFKTIEFILKRKNKLKLSYIQNKLRERNVKIITIYDKQYPILLKQISNPPFLFYLRGKIDNTPKISVVGSRKMSDYGKQIIKKIIPDISKYFVIVSGGASGCDTQSHIQALKHLNKTISVIGTGIDIDYPTGNKKLYDKIVDFGGGIISIFPISEVGNPYNFPIRNEIVAGLSVGVYIIEAMKKSGSLITAGLALENGKDVFSTPGSIFTVNSEGCNILIKNGTSKMVISSEDILEEYNIKKLNNNSIKKEFICKIEEEIYNLLLLESYNIDGLSKKTNIDVKVLMLKLSIMEINKIIKKGEGGKYLIY